MNSPEKSDMRETSHDATGPYAEFAQSAAVMASSNSVLVEKERNKLEGGKDGASERLALGLWEGLMDAVQSTENASV